MSFQITKVAVTAVIPTLGRSAVLDKTLERVFACRPLPEEVIVYVDGGNARAEEAVSERWPGVRVLGGERRLGPGGARGVLIKAAANELVTMFDDDSFPERPDFFARAVRAASDYPEAAVISAASHEAEWKDASPRQIAVYSGCGCVIRRSWFLKAPGFVPLLVAYGMEEVDVSLQLHDLGGQVVHLPDLRVVHDHPWRTADDAALNAASIANQALLPFLRYPVWLWPLGLLQLTLMVARLWMRGGHKGVWKGIASIPGHWWRYAAYRKPVSSPVVLSWIRLKRRPKALVAGF